MNPFKWLRRWLARRRERWERVQFYRFACQTHRIDTDISVDTMLTLYDMPIDAVRTLQENSLDIDFRVTCDLTIQFRNGRMPPPGYLRSVLMSLHLRRQGQ